MKSRQEQYLAPTKGEGPELLPEAFPIAILFSTASAQRTYTEIGPDPLSLADLDALFNIEGLSIWEKQFSLMMLLHLDHIFLEESYKRIESERKKAESANKRKRK